MKILIVHNYYKIRAGEFTVLNNEIKLLKEKGHDVIIFYRDNKNITSIFLKIYYFINVVYSKKIFNEFNSILKIEKPDIIHVHNFFPQITPSIFYVANKNKIPIIQTLHNYRLICPSTILMYKNKIYEKSINKGPFSTVLDKVYKNSYFGTFALAIMISYHKNKGTWEDKVDSFIALTSFSKSKFIEAGFSAKKIKIKPNFIYDIKTQKNNRKKQFALFVGRISEEKGIRSLINAWVNIDYQLIIAGSGPLNNYVQSKVNKNIIFLGEQTKNQVIELMNSASFLIIPSIWYEGFPMVIIEAYSAGLPVIGSKIGSIKEVIKNNITGLHFNPNDSNDIKEKVNKIICNNELLKKLSINARQEYLKNYIPEKNYKILIKIYNEVINERPNSY